MGTEFVPFPDYIDRLRKAAHDPNRSPDQRSVLSGILDSYQGSQVVHTYVDGGVHFDCIQTAPQPGGGHEPVRAPEPATMRGEQTPLSGGVTSATEAERRDQFGNRVFCPPGATARARPALERAAETESARDYYGKAPGGGALPPQGSGPQGAG